MKFGVVVFPGSNCDRDLLHVVQRVMGCDARMIWHKESDLSDFTPSDCILLPGGFSYGDYLRTGAIARFSPVMESVIAFAGRGGKVFGICNGFQILCESGLLPGALLRNNNRQYVCRNIYLEPATRNSLITRHIPEGKVLKVPIAHGEGRYYCDADTLKTLQSNEQILFRYCDAEGHTTQEANPNGSIDHIAGICNTGRNVFGMMPHPERCAEDALGNTDGRLLFESLVGHAAQFVM